MGMKMKKSWVLPVLAAGILAAGLAGCEKKDPYGLSAKDPVTITIWHYYNGVQKEGFDQLVQTFNESEGREKGIIVEAYSKGSIDDLSQAVTDSIDKKIGSDPVPDVFAAYADKVYEIDQRDMAVDLSKYLTADEIGEYVDAYIEEGRFDGSEGIKVFPVAKSTEVFAINKTDWDKFAEATGETDAAFSTWEGITRVAEKYYKWTDSLTETPDDGKAFFGRDAFANYMISGYRQLATDIFSKNGDEVKLNFEEDVAKKLWDNYYIPYIRGYFASSGKFRSDDIKVGNILACVSASSGVTYFPTQVTLNDEESYPIELEVLENPKFEGGRDYQIQQGAGMLVLKSDEKEQLASAEFLKWFTEDEQDIAFSTASGYLPVKKSANQIESVEKVTKVDKEVKDVLDTSFQMIRENNMYTSVPFSNGTSAREVLENTMGDLAKEDRKTVQTNLESGMPLEEAVSYFETEDYFKAWYEDTKAQLETLVK